jgi:hypothetical protein
MSSGMFNFFALTVMAFTPNEVGSNSRASDLQGAGMNNAGARQDAGETPR